MESRCALADVTTVELLDDELIKLRNALDVHIAFTIHSIHTARREDTKCALQYDRKWPSRLYSIKRSGK